MAKSRTKNSLLSMFAAIVYYIVVIVAGLVNRKFLISILGVEYQGINGVFSSVLSLLGVAELGIGTAIIYHLYKPLADKNINAIKSIMRFYQKCYIGIALFMFVLGTLLSLRLDFFVNKTNIPLNLTIVYFLMLFDSIATYTFAYKRSILYADQKNYIISNVNSIFVVTYNIVQILILYWTHDYYLYLFSRLAFRLIENIAINIIVNRLYPYLRDKDYRPISKEIVSDIILKIKGLLFHKISTFIVNGTDNILISKFLGLSIVGIYSNYFYVINSINSLLQQAFDGITGSVGNLLVTTEKKKRLLVFKELNLINTLLSTIAINLIIVLINPFIIFVFGKEYCLSGPVTFVLSINMVLTNQRRVFGMFKSAAGIQYEDRYVPVVESILNLGMSLLLLHYYGLIGVFLGTLISQLCDFSYTFPKFVYHQILGMHYKNYCCYIAKIIFFQIFSCTLCFFIINQFASITVSSCLLYATITLLSTLLLFHIYFHRTTEYCDLLVRLITLLKKR